MKKVLLLGIFILSLGACKKDALIPAVDNTEDLLQGEWKYIYQATSWIRRNDSSMTYDTIAFFQRPFTNRFIRFTSGGSGNFFNSASQGRGIGRTFEIYSLNSTDTILGSYLYIQAQKRLQMTAFFDSINSVYDVARIDENDLILGTSEVVTYPDIQATDFITDTIIAFRSDR